VVRSKRFWTVVRDSNPKKQGALYDEGGGNWAARTTVLSKCEGRDEKKKFLLFREKMCCESMNPRGKKDKGGTCEGGTG